MTVGGADFAKAVRSILPRQRTGQLGYVVISQPGPSTLRLQGFYAGVEIAAERTWADALQVNARQLRGFASGRQSATVRLVFFGGSLVINDTIGAGRALPDALALPPSYVPTKRPGAPGGRRQKPRA